VSDRPYRIVSRCVTTSTDIFLKKYKQYDFLERRATTASAGSYCKIKSVAVCLDKDVARLRTIISKKFNNNALVSFFLDNSPQTKAILSSGRI
jgi:hypothetical protein